MATATESKGGIRDRAVKRIGDVLFYDIKDIEIEPGHNLRDFSSPRMKARVQELADSLKENGQREAIKIRLDKATGKIFVVSGETRYYAMKLAMKQGASFPGIKAIGDDSKMSAEDRIAALFLDNDQENFTPLEKAEGCLRLEKRGFNHTEIATRTGLSQPYVSSLLQLIHGPKEVRDLVNAGKVSATEATKVLKEHPEKAAEILSDAVATASMNGGGRATATHVEATKAKKKIAPSGGAPLWTTKPIMRGIITTLCEIALDTSAGYKPTQGYRGWAKDALENADIDAKAWIAEYGEKEE